MLSEDNIIGKLNDERFAKMSEKYEQEQRDLRDDVVSLEASVAESEGKLGNVGHFIALVREYAEVETLSQGMVNAMIDKIIVHEPIVAYGKNRTQRVEILFSGVGKIEQTHEQMKTPNSVNDEAAS